MRFVEFVKAGLFLSTPSARRATQRHSHWHSVQSISIHALREEGDPYHSRRPAGRGQISIHALREEGDQGADWFVGFAKISIHALREEGDAGNRPDNLRRRLISIHALREEGDPSILCCSTNS